MDFNSKEWCGKWTNFENYIYSTNEDLVQVWKEVDELTRDIPVFSNGAKAFWQRACSTVTKENQERLGGWNVDAFEEGFVIDWLNVEGKSLGKYEYILESVVEKGLEGKKNFLFFAPNAEENCAFRYLVSMMPMPERDARLQGGYISHFHFQFASAKKDLIMEGSIVNARWYATMCDAEGTILEQCNMIRGLHRIPLWKTYQQS